jgi:tetratricopeptide (TPR) repeat protein
MRPVVDKGARDPSSLSIRRPFGYYLLIRRVRASGALREVLVRLYELKIWPKSQENVWRMVDVTDRQTLAHLHETIRNEFGLTGDHLYCFYLSDKAYDPKKAYGGPRADTSCFADKTNFASLGLKRGRRFLDLFDFAAEHFFHVLVQRVRGAPDNGRFPAVSGRQGKFALPPVENPPPPEPTRGPCDDIENELRTIAIAWSQGKRPSKGALKKEYDLSVGFAERVKGDWSVVKRVERKTGADVSGWIVGLPEALAAEGFFEEALALIEKFAELEPESLLGDRGFVLLKAGRTEDAVQAVSAVTTRFNEDAWVWAKGADVLSRAGKPADAERAYRRALDLAGNAQYLRDSILERLLALLEEQGKTNAAHDLAEDEKRRRARNER